MLSDCGRYSEWHSQLASSRSVVEAAVCATALGTEVGRHGGGIRGLHQVIQLRALDALGVELAGIVRRAFFRRSRITFSSPALGHRTPSRNTEKLCCMQDCSALRISTGSSPNGCCSNGSDGPARLTSESLASRLTPCSSSDSCRCMPAERPNTTGRAASCRPSGWRRAPIRRRFRPPRTTPGSPRLRLSRSLSTPRLVMVGMPPIIYSGRLG